MGPGQGTFVQAAIETELTRLLGEQGVSSSSTGARPHLTAGSIQLTDNIQPARLGQQIAAAIHTNIAPKQVSQNLAPRENK